MAAKNRKGLGKGLGALFVENTDATSENDFDILAEFNEDLSEDDINRIKLIKIRDIEPNKGQPRKNFDKEKLEILSNSIIQHGIVQPIIVKSNINGSYTIIAGERRWRASKIAGLREIPCIVRDLEDSDIMQIALIENLQREDLNAIEEAEGYKNLMVSCNMTQEDVAKKIGKSRSAIANSLRLNNLSDEIKTFVIDGKLSQGHARTLLGLNNSEKQVELAKQIIERGLNVRQVEHLVNSINNQKVKIDKNNPLSGMMKKYFTDVENTLGSKFGTKVKISDGAKKGKIEIEYYSKDDLERILFELKK